MNVENERQTAQTDHQDDDRVPAGSPPEGDATEGEGRATSPLDMARERIDELEAALQAAGDRELRAQAEFENFRKRIRREIEDEKKYASLPLVEELLPVVDDLERALESAKSAEDQAIVEGVRLVLQRFKTALERGRVTEIDATGAFDPHRHEAIAQIPGDAPQGTILQVARTGYLLHDRVVRPAQVVVSAGKPG